MSDPSIVPLLVGFIAVILLGCLLCLIGIDKSTGDIKRILEARKEGK